MLLSHSWYHATVFNVQVASKLGGMNLVLPFAYDALMGKGYRAGGGAAKLVTRHKVRPTFLLLLTAP